MLDRLDSFKSHSMTEIWTFIKLYYIFSQCSDISTYVTDRLNKDNNLCDNIENVDNWGHDWDNVSDKTISPRVIFRPYYCWYNCHYFL